MQKHGKQRDIAAGRHGRGDPRVLVPRVTYVPTVRTTAVRSGITYAKCCKNRKELGFLIPSCFRAWIGKSRALLRSLLVACCVQRGDGESRSLNRQSIGFTPSLSI